MTFFGGDSTMHRLADFSIHLSMSPIADAEGWANAPEGAKEFTIYYMYGKVQKPVLILKNAEGKYDRLAVYETKEDAEPAFILENDVFTRDCKVMLPTKAGMVETVRDMRALKIAEDGSYVRLWVGEAMNCEDNRVWYPQWIFDSIKENVGMPCGSSMAAGQDEDLIMKCSQEQWKHCAEWQSAAMRYMIDEQDIEVIFSHFHGPDLAGHSYMKYLKDRDTSIVNGM